MNSEVMKTFVKCPECRKLVSTESLNNTTLTCPLCGYEGKLNFDKTICEIELDKPDYEPLIERDQLLDSIMITMSEATESMLHISILRDKITPREQTSLLVTLKLLQAPKRQIDGVLEDIS